MHEKTPGPPCNVSGGTGSPSLYLEALRIPAAGRAGIPARGLWRRRVAQPRSGLLAGPGRQHISGDAGVACGRSADGCRRSRPSRGHVSALTKSSRWWARAGWARSTGPGTRGSSGSSQSRCCRTETPCPQSALERFRREARTASALNHPNICTIYDVGDEPPFIAMELLEGEPLDRRLASRPYRSRRPRRCRHRRSRCTRRRAPDRDRPSRHQAGEHLHDRREVPRSWTSALAKMSAGGTDDDPGDRLDGREARLTDPHHAIGTVSYMSPEQIRAQPIDARSDLFSFGVVLYEMLTGARPFRGNSAAAIAAAILEGARPPASPENGAVPPDLSRIAGRCLENDRDRRYQHAAELLTDLQRSKQGRSASATSRPAVTRRRTWLTLAATAVAIIVARHRRLRRRSRAVRA